MESIYSLTMYISNILHPIFFLSLTYFSHSSEWPDPEEFEENITVRGIDKGPLKFKLPNVSEIDIAGIEEVKEELISFPPFADLKNLLQPM